jgi:hypothetical protein
MEASGQLHAWPLYYWCKSPRYPLDRRLDGPPYSIKEVESGCLFLETYSSTQICIMTALYFDLRLMQITPAPKDYSDKQKLQKSCISTVYYL